MSIDFDRLLIVAQTDFTEMVEDVNEMVSVGLKTNSRSHHDTSLDGVELSSTWVNWYYCRMFQGTRANVPILARMGH